MSWLFCKNGYSAGSEDEAIGLPGVLEDSEEVGDGDGDGDGGGPLPTSDSESVAANWKTLERSFER